MSVHPNRAGPCWCESPGSLRTNLLRLDGQVAAIVNVEKNVARPATISSAVAQHLGPLVKQMGLGAEDEMVEQAGGALLETAKAGFVREAVTIRRQIARHGVAEPGE